MDHHAFSLLSGQLSQILKRNIDLSKNGEFPEKYGAEPKIAEAKPEQLT